MVDNDLSNYANYLLVIKSVIKLGGKENHRIVQDENK